MVFQLLVINTATISITLVLPIKWLWLKCESSNRWSHSISVRVQGKPTHIHITPKNLLNQYRGFVPWGKYWKLFCPIFIGWVHGKLCQVCKCHWRANKTNKYKLYSSWVFWRSWLYSCLRILINRPWKLASGYSGLCFEEAFCRIWC